MEGSKMETRWDAVQSSTILVEAWYVGKVRYGTALFFDDQLDTTNKYSSRQYCGSMLQLVQLINWYHHGSKAEMQFSISTPRNILEHVYSPITWSVHPRPRSSEGPNAPALDEDQWQLQQPAATSFYPSPSRHDLDRKGTHEQENVRAI